MWAYKVAEAGLLEKVTLDGPDESALTPGNVVLRLQVAGICGSDLPKFLGRRLPTDPVIGFPLHELCGEITASRDPALAVGTRVVGMAKGLNGFSEYVVNPGSLLRAIPDDMPFETAAMIQPASTVMNALSRIPDPAGKRVAVIGQGPLGLLFSSIMKWRGAAHVTGVDRVDRTDVAAAYGVDESIRASSDVWARELAEADQPDICVEAVGHQQGTLNDVINATKRWGHIFAFGVPDDSHYAIAFERLFRKDLTLAAGTTTDYQRFLVEAREYVEADHAARETYITATFPFSRAQEAFELSSVPAPGRLKVVLAEGA